MNTPTPGAASELLPCPICSGRCEIKRGVHTKYVMCRKCELMGPNLSRDEELIAHWNTRPPTPVQVTPVDGGSASDSTKESFREAVAQILSQCYAMTEALCAAFLSETGCVPSDAEIVQQWTNADRTECRIFIRRRDKSNDPAPPPTDRVQPVQYDEIDIFEEALRRVEANYPLSVFPEDGESLDCKSASMARLTCRNVRYELERFMADRIEPDRAQPERVEAGHDREQWRRVLNSLSNQRDGYSGYADACEEIHTIAKAEYQRLSKEDDRG